MDNQTYNKEFDSLFEKSFRIMTKGMEEHKFRHYNNSLGMMIYNKEQLRREMYKRRMLPYDTCEELEQEYRRGKDKPYDSISKEAMDVLRSLRMCADSKGYIKVEGRAYEALKKIGAIGNYVDTSKFKVNDGGFA